MTHESVTPGQSHSDFVASRRVMPHFSPPPPHSGTNSVKPRRGLLRSVLAGLFDRSSSPPTPASYLNPNSSSSPSFALPIRPRRALSGMAILLVLAIGLLMASSVPVGAQENGAIEYAENGDGAVATFTATDPEDDEVTWSKSGADADLFAISEDGVLTFVSPPDYEEPGDGGGNNIYEVTVTATDDDAVMALAGTHNVMVEVTNEEEVAAVGIELSSLQPQVSTSITVDYVDGVGNPLVDAVGADHNGIMDDDRDKDSATSSDIPATDVTWQWSKSSSKGGTYTDIPGDEAKTVSYTPGSADRGMHLRVTGTYEDGEGEGKTVEATSAYPVRAFPGSNSAPAFPEDFDTETADNQMPAAEIDDGATAGAAAGDPITASDANSDRLTYSLTAAGNAIDADVFQINRETGQVTVGLGKTVHPTSDTGETASDTVALGDSFAFTITATDPSGLTDTVTMTVTVDAEDEAPVFTGGEAAHTFKEIPVGTASPDLQVDTFTASDVERDTVAYTMSGADSSKFTLGDAGLLSFQAAAEPDFETPGSADGDNIYEITITAASTGSATEKRTALDVTVTVTNENDRGTITLSAAQPRLGTALTATAPSDTDGGVSGVTWKWESAVAIADFATANADITEIEGATSASYTPVVGDVDRALRATASYTDAHGPDKSTSVVADQLVASARNLAPVFTDEDEDTDGVQLNPREVPENSAADTDVGAPIGATDTEDDETADDSALTFALSGADAGLFDIASPGGQITVEAGAQLDYETKDTYTVTITVRDLEGLNSSIDLTIKITNVNEAPAVTGVSSTKYVENEEDPVATFSAEDPEDDEVTWSKSGADADLFAISEDGVLTFVSPPDYEEPGDGGGNNIYEVTVTATDDDAVMALAGTHNVMVEVTNEEEVAAVGIELSSLQPQVSTSITVDYVDGVGNPLVDAVGADHNGIMDDDRDKDSATSSDIPATDVTWQWSKSSSKGGTYTDIPGDEAKTVSYTPGSADRGMHLRVTGTYEDGEGEGKTVEATSAYPVRAFPGSNSAPAFPEDFDTETADNQMPAAEIDDGATAGAAAGDPITASDANSDRLTYSLTAAGNAIDADVFQINRETGQVTVGLGKTVHPTSDTGETASDTVALGDSFAFTITATDPSGLTDTVTMTVTVDAEDEAPVFTGGEAAHTFKEIPVGTASPDLQVDTFTASDVERDTVAYTMSGADSSKFTLGDAGLLSFQAAAEPDFETPGSADGDNIYEITITAASTGSATEKRTALDVTVTVTNENDRGTITLSAAQPRLGTALTATAPSDTDGGVSGVTWKWESAVAIADFATANADITEIEGATSASYTPVVGDVDRALRATASYTDAHGPDKSTSVVADQLVASARNLAPVFTDEDEDTDGVQLNPREVPENSAADTDVGAPIGATDTEDDETADDSALTFALSGADAGLFDIASPGGQITVEAGAQLDYETKDTYTVTITVRDLEGLNSSINLTIKVTNVNEAPTITLGGLAISGNRNPEVEEGMTAVDTYTASGPDAASAMWTLGGDDVGAFSISSSGEITFASVPDYENPADADTDNVYMVTVEAGDGTYMDTHEVTVTVTNAEETGTAALSSDMLIVGEAVTATVTDPDVVTAGTEMWQWARADDAGFTMNAEDIAGATMASYTPVEADGGKYLRASVAYNDGYGADEAEATGDHAVTSNRPPAFDMATTSRDVAENSEADALVGEPVVATDPDNDDVTYALSGADATSFSIHDNGQITVGQGTMLDFEARTTYTVTVTATNPSGETATIEVTINVTNVGLDTPTTCGLCYDINDSGRIDKPEMIQAINDYLYGSGASAISKEDMIEVINLYLFG